MLLGHLARLGQRKAELRAQPDGLRPRHFVVLTVLRDGGPVGQRALAEALQLDPTNVVAVLNDLETRGFISRTRDAEDRRRHIVAATEDGLAALQVEECAYAEIEAHVLGALDDDERAQLHSLLSRAATATPTDACSAIGDSEGGACDGPLDAGVC